MYYANEESDCVIGDFTKTVQHSIKNISRTIGAVFFKLGTTDVQISLKIKEIFQKEKKAILLYFEKPFN